MGERTLNNDGFCNACVDLIKNPTTGAKNSTAFYHNDTTNVLACDGSVINIPFTSVAGHPMVMLHGGWYKFR